MSYFPRNGRSRERGSYSYGDRRRNGRERGRSWTRDRSYASFRPRGHDNYDNRDHHRYRRRDDEVVLIRRDRESEEVNTVPDDNRKELIRHSPERKSKTYQVKADIKHESAPANHHNPEQPDPTGAWNLNYRRDASNFLANPITLPRPVEEHKKQAPIVPEPPGPDSLQLNPENQAFVNACISNFKTRGDYDRIRRECMLDIDTKPAFINVMGKVADITNRFLQTAQFHPNMDKAKMRESLKKSFEISRSYQNGVESLVNQILLPKMQSMAPMLEKEVYNILGKVSSSDCTNGANGEIASEPQQQTPHCPTTMKAATIHQALPCTVSCLLPVNVAIDSKIAASPLPATITNLHPMPSSVCQNQPPNVVCNEGDLQLHEDIMEAINHANETTVVHASSNNVDHCTENYAMVESNINDYIRTKNVETVEQASNSNIENNMNKINNELLEKGSCQTKPELTVTYYEDDDYEEEFIMEEESEEESPKFEKIGEVSPVRLDMLPPDYDYTIPDYDSAVQENEQVNNFSAVIESSSGNSGIIPTPIECTPQQIGTDENNVEIKQKSLCKFLDPVDLTNYKRKMVFFQCLYKLSPTKGKTKIVSNRIDNVKC